MKPINTSRCLLHVLVCTNERPDGSRLPCCDDGGGAEIYERFRRWVDSRGLLTRIWVTKTDCMGWCNRDGTTVALYPDDIMYRAVSPEDCDELIERHLEPLDGVK